MKTGKTNKVGLAGQLIIVFALVNLFACNQNSNTGKNSMGESKQKSDIKLQKEHDLLIGEYKAVCYSGFRSGQHPDRGEGAINPSYEETLEDLKILSEDCDFRLIRIYDSGENSEMVLRVIEENNLKIKVMLGIWLRAELSAHETCEWLTEPIPEDELQQNKKLNLEEIDKGVQLAKKYEDIIVAVNVGNEALVEWNDHMVDTDTIISYVKRVQKSVVQPVTVADNYKWWADHGTKLAKAVDFVSIHVYPVWEGKDIDEGLSYSIENVLEVMKALPGSKIVITEAGWATIATEFGERASQEKQKQYYDEIMSWSKKNNVTTFFFEAFDEDWKGNPNNPLGAEKHWGLFTVDREPKLVMKSLLKRK